MQRILSFLIVILFFVFVPSAMAHPLDISYTDLHLFNDFNNKPLPQNMIVAEVYLPWLQASLLVQRSEKIASPEPKLLPKYQKPYADYLSKHIVITNNGRDCQPIYGLPPQQPEQEILFGRGVMIPARYQCEKNLDEIKLTSTVFIDEFPAQRNNINFYNGPELALKGFVLTKQAINLETSTAELKNPPASNAPAGKKLSLLEKISQGYLDVRTTSIIKAVLFVFLLGLLHTLEAGHSKTILASFLIQKNVRMSDGFIFAGIFTVTHIADIVLLGGLLYVTNAFVDVFARLTYLQIFSFYALFFISLYMLFKNLSEYVRMKLSRLIGEQEVKIDEHKELIKISTKDIKKQFMLGFLTGLSPCLFGWSIFMVILTTKKIWVVFPVILSFAFGIYVALSLLVIIIVKTKSGIFGRFSWVSEISPIVSSALLVVFALGMIV